ncbi:hypothetical protein D1872_272060 [compost metagenome]
MRKENGDVFSSYELFREGKYVLLNLVHDQLVEGIIRRLPVQHFTWVSATLAEPALDWNNVHTAMIRPDGYIAWAISDQERPLERCIEEGIRSISKG